MKMMKQVLVIDFIRFSFIVNNYLKDQTILPRLSFEKKIIAHQSNRLNNTFGQINIPFQSNKEIKINNDKLVPLRCKTPHENGKYNCIFE